MILRPEIKCHSYKGNRHRAPTTRTLYQTSWGGVEWSRHQNSNQYQRRTTHNHREPGTPSSGTAGVAEQQGSQILPTTMKTNLNDSPNGNGAQKPDTTSPSKKRPLSRQCTVPGCPTRGAVDETGTCSAHGAKRKRCKIEGCPNGKWLTKLLCSETYVMHMMCTSRENRDKL